MPSDSNSGQVRITPTGILVGLAAVLVPEIGHSFNLVTGSIVPFKALLSGWLTESKVICPIGSPILPPWSRSMIWNPPSPCSAASPTPFVGLLSSNTYTVSCAAGTGLGSTRTVTGAKAVRPAAAGDWIGAPPMLCPQVEGATAFGSVGGSKHLDGDPLYARMNGLAASPGKIDM